MDKKWNEYIGKRIRVKNSDKGGQYEGTFAGIQNNKLILNDCVPIMFVVCDGQYKTESRISSGGKRRFDIDKITFEVIKV